MQDMMIRLFVYVQNLGVKVREERGQTSVEWLGIGAFVVAVIVALSQLDFAHPIQKVIQAALDKVTSIINGK